MAKLDDISQAIGVLQGTLGQHCIDDDRRHLENAATLHEIKAELGLLGDTVRPLAEAVKSMKPDIADYRERRAEGRGMSRLAHWVWVVIAAVGGAIGSAIGLRAH